MPIPVNSNFKMGAPLPIDDRLTLSYAQMANIDDNVMPEVYLTVCKNDGCIYLYNKNNSFVEKTGKFIKFESNSSNQYTSQIIFSTHLEFPNIGEPETIYVSTDEDIMYIYDEENQTYVAISQPDFDTIQSTL